MSTQSSVLIRHPKVTENRGIQMEEASHLNSDPIEFSLKFCYTKAKIKKNKKYEYMYVICFC